MVKLPCTLAAAAFSEMLGGWWCPGMLVTFCNTSKWAIIPKTTLSLTIMKTILLFNTKIMDVELLKIGYLGTSTTNILHKSKKYYCEDAPSIFNVPLLYIQL
jgi:hypothetical protein